MQEAKLCLITGATAGIGRATALDLARKGATVVITGRNPSKARTTVAELKTASGNPNIDFLIADLSSQSQIHQLVEEFKAKYDRLDVLINNAGGVFAKRQTSPDGVEYTLAFNHLAPFLLTNLLLDRLKAAGLARVITVASAAAQSGQIDFDDLGSEKKYRAFQVYSNTKLMNILFSNELAKRLVGSGVTSNALHPGFVASRFGKNNGGLYTVAMTLARPFAISPAEGAKTSIYLASSETVEGVSGKFFTKCAEANPPSPLATDASLAERLWEVSEKLCGLKA